MTRASIALSPRFPVFLPGSYHFPFEVLNVRLLSPPLAVHPVATVPDAPGQLASESEAVPGEGLKEPLTWPSVMLIFARLGKPLNLNDGGWVQSVGLAPAGVLQVILNFAFVGVMAVPEKIVAQSLAWPAMLNVIVPAMLPSAITPVLVTHGLAVLPSDAFTTIFSTFAVPPSMSGGEKVIAPVQVPCAGLHVTVPGYGGLTTAPAVPTAATAVKPADRHTAATINTDLRNIDISPLV
jgi:hypothetical protein